jgi:NAD(P)-dependent dehydrogenase (short-subunit alcohol dehydrogenase family)
MGTSRTVLITGCSTGIGRATALRLARAGHVVYATARRPETVADLEAAGCRPLRLDVTDEPSMVAAVDAVVAERGAVDVLVNNAGYSQGGAVETLAMDALRRQFETNVFGLVRLCQLVLPGMRERRWGRIVNVSSMGGRFTFPGGGAYHATKHAVEALSDALRFEVAGFGVEVVVVQPGLIRTAFGDTAVAGIERSADGPYARFNATVAKATASVYRNPLLARLGGDGDTVARAIERAIERPRPRVRVTPSAHLMLAQRRLVSDRMWDRLMATTFPRPGAER